MESDGLNLGLGNPTQFWSDESEVMSSDGKITFKAPVESSLLLVRFRNGEQVSGIEHFLFSVQNEENIDKSM